MPGAARYGDTCTGHGCFGSRANTQGSDNVFVNDKPAHRQGDSWAVHKCRRFLSTSSHDGYLAKGSSTIYVNDKQAGRIGDPVNCGSQVQTGSSDVLKGP